MDEYIIDLSDANERNVFLAKLREFKGKHRITITRYAKRRSDRQNRWYWGFFVRPLAEAICEQGEIVTDGEVHELLKSMFLRKSIVGKGGEIIGEIVRSTAELNTYEFNRFLDQCRSYLATEWHIEVPDPDVYHEIPDPDEIPPDGIEEPFSEYPTADDQVLFTDAVLWPEPVED